MDNRLTKEQIQGWKMNNGAMSPNEFRALCDLALAALPETGTHTDHPLRHFDRTCPACTEGDTPRPARPVMSDGNLSGWSVYVTSLERYTDQLEQLYGAACLQLQARGDKAVALSAIGQRTELTGGGSASLNGWPGNRGTAPQGVQECRENSGAADGGERPAPLSTTQPLKK